MWLSYFPRTFHLPRMPKSGLFQFNCSVSRRQALKTLSNIYSQSKLCIPTNFIIKQDVNLRLYLTATVTERFASTPPVPGPTNPTPTVIRNAFVIRLKPGGPLEPRVKKVCCATHVLHTLFSFRCTHAVPFRRFQRIAPQKATVDIIIDRSITDPFVMLLGSQIY